MLIHNPESTEGLRNHTMITVVVAKDAANALGAIVLRQLPNLDQCDWGRYEPSVYLGVCTLRGKGEVGLASAVVSELGEVLTVRLNPPLLSWGKQRMLSSVALILSPVFINGQQNCSRMVRTQSVISDLPCV